ncbi:MAG: SDR family oxidoreductase [Elusimicrobiota bacterium]|jgi:dTDP-4-dehydrorhamnose reductase
MRFLIPGINGLLGSNLARCLGRRGHTIVGNGRQPSTPSPVERYLPGDLSQPPFASRLVAQAKPDVIINCVGLANVNLCESDPGMARTVNVLTAMNLAKAAAAAGIRFLHISTDHLFKGDEPFRKETDPPAPVNEYGRSKWEGEKAVLETCTQAAVIRTNFYGWSPAGHAPTFAEWLYQSLSEKHPIHLYTDYYFNSIEVSYLAEALEEVTHSNYRGLLNIASPERVSKYEFGRALAEVFRLSMKSVTACSFEPKTMAVKRPRDLSLSTALFSSHFKTALPNLREGLRRLHEERLTTQTGRRTPA